MIEVVFFITEGDLFLLHLFTLQTTQILYPVCVFSDPYYTCHGVLYSYHTATVNTTRLNIEPAS